MSWKQSKSGASVLNELENLYNEVGALQRAVESKTAANIILREELKECQRERDKFRMMAESQPVSSSVTSLSGLLYQNKSHSAMLSGSEGTLAQLLSQTKEENKHLRLEMTQLRCKLHDAQSDLKVLRDERLRYLDHTKKRMSFSTSSQLAQQERESLILQLEEFSAKCHASEGDVRCLLEEREELIQEREDIRHKLCRLNHILNKLLLKDSWNETLPYSVVDLDAIITENRYLLQRLKQIKEEKCIAQTNASKYKSALEKCRSSPGSLKLGSGENLIVTPKQVSEYLIQHEGELGKEAEQDLKSLCIALVDALNQKSLVVKTQKAANKMLIERLGEIEKRHCVEPQTKSHTMETALVSETLMDGYNQSSNLQTPFNDVITESNKLLKEVQKLPENETETKITHSPPVTKHKETIEREIKSSSESDLEEVVPLEMLDAYITGLKRKQNRDPKNNEETTSIQSKHSSINDEEPFDNIDFSDYDSDNSNLDEKLSNWQQEFHKKTENFNYSPNKKARQKEEDAFQNL